MLLKSSWLYSYSSDSTHIYSVPALRIIEFNNSRDWFQVERQIPRKYFLVDWEVLTCKAGPKSSKGSPEMSMNISLRWLYLSWALKEVQPVSCKWCEKDPEGLKNDRHTVMYPRTLPHQTNHAWNSVAAIVKGVVGDTSTRSGLKRWWTELPCFLLQC